jgi:hypothetical protein
MANTDTAFILSKHGSPITQLTSGAGAGKIKFIVGGAVKSASDTTAGKVGPTGIVLPLHGASITSFPDHDSTMSHTATNVIGDPAEGNYALTSGDLFKADSDWSEKNGGAQKFVNAVLDSAYRGYTSGVAQSSGLSSMTVTRGDLSLSNTAVNDGTGVINTYSRSYTVNFKYFQSGTINASGSLDPSKPDIADDNSDGAPF